MTADWSSRFHYPELSGSDISVTPGVHGYVISRLRGESSVCVPVKTEVTWREAIFGALTLAAAAGGRVLASRRGGPFEIVDENRRWLGPEQYWLPYEEHVVRKHAPEVPGLYALRGSAPIFLGDTENLRERLLYHLRDPLPCPQALNQLLFCCEPVLDPSIRSERAIDLITWWTLPCNSVS